MPFIPSTTYGTAGQVTSLVRSLVGDVDANWATDAKLLPYLNAAYRDVQAEVANSGGDGFTTDNVLLVVAAVPANQQDPGTQAVINDATAPPNQLPSNLLIPLRMWERPNGSTQEFSEMIDLSNKGGLPSRMQGSSLDVWEWRTDGIYFIGATQDVQVRLRYQGAFADLTGASDTIMIRMAQNALAYRTAELAGAARGSVLIEQADALYASALETVVSRNIRANQRQGVRRRPYGGARRGRMWDSL